MTDVSTPVRRLWPGERPPVVEHPAPIVVNRPATDDEIPRGARTIATLAKRHEWTVEATYSRGSRPGRAVTEVDVLVLRLRRRDTAAWAAWLNGKFDDAQIRRPRDIARTVNLTALRAELASALDGDA